MAEAPKQQPDVLLEQMSKRVASILGVNEAREPDIAEALTLIRESLYVWTMNDNPHVRADRLPLCQWTGDDDGVWHTDCGEAFFFGPSENKMKFCGYCGKLLEEVKYVEPPDDEDEVSTTPAETKRIGLGS